MKAVVALLLVVCASASTNYTAGRRVRPSAGCSRKSTYARGAPTSYNIDTTDQRLGSLQRSFVLNVPDSLRVNEPAPLLVYFHGQGGQAMTTARGQAQHFPEYISAFPQGLNDNAGSSCGTGWNTGSNGKASACTSLANRHSCCYSSCRTLGTCTGDGADARCSWSTCWDDVAFTSQLIDDLASNSCIDLSSVFISGASNGGMVAFEVAAGLGDKIAATIPVFGLPLLGGLRVPNELADVSYMFLSGRQDRVVTIDGSLSAQGWYYERYEQASEAYANVHGCSSRTQRVTTQWDGINNLECYEYTGCNSGRVMDCLYDGGHHYPSGSAGQELSRWFLESVRAQ